MANNSSEYRVKLGLDVDIKSAQQNLLNFQQSLNKISSMNVGDLGLSKKLNEASQAAQSLQTHLNNAFDVKTGNLDLGKFQASLQKSNQTVAQLGQNLLKAGPAGEQAFLQMTRALQNANIKMLETESRLGKLMTTFKNTLRWQISASALNAMVSGFQNALKYSQDLNKSLNDIRIVTGYSADKMAQFAKQANKAADVLNTSTLKYTDASLIYFQQGLGDKEVEERTNTTIKLMNVTGESAETASNWMTSIWNNFDDGSKSLEYYADVLAKLGATTASSADEIATGLEKFAAIGETVGLSYEYAAAALATVTAETRQSAEVVGTAFKTLFARIQDLELGKTLDDGTTLGQYSQAIAAVGINIKDANGGIKDMDIILDELGAKWNLLSKDTQIALAQNVAGIRQYTQFMAIMDNWDVFEENVKSAKEAGGTLEEQAQIYADSWEAAQADVQNSLEKLWGSLVPEDQLIDLYHGFAEVLDVVDTLTNAIGGFESLILLVSNLLITKFQSSLTNSINQGISSLGMLKTRIKDTFVGLQLNTIRNPLSEKGRIQIANNAAKNSFNPLTQSQKDQTSSIEEALNTPGISEGFKAELTVMKEVNGYQNLIANNSRLITSEQKQKLSLLLEELKVNGEIQKTLIAKKQSLQEEIALRTDNLDQQHWELDRRRDFNLYGEETTVIGGTNQFATEAGDVEEAARRAAEAGISSTIDQTGRRIQYEVADAESDERLLRLKEEQLNKVQLIGEAETRVQAIISSSADEEEKKLQIRKISKEYAAQGVDLGIKGLRTSRSMGEAVKERVKHEQNISRALTNNNTLTRTALAQGRQNAALSKEEETSLKQQENIRKRLNNLLTTAGKSFTSLGNVLTSGASAAMQVTMGINAISNAIESFKDPTADLSQKLTGLFMGITMLIPGISGAFNLLSGYLSSIVLKMTTVGGLLTLNEGQTWKNVLAQQALAKVTDETSDEQIELALAEALATTTGVSSDVAATAAKEILIKTKEKNNLTTNAEALALLKNSKALDTDTAKTVANTAAKMASQWWLLAIVAAIAAVTIAINHQNKAQEKALERDKEAVKQSKENIEALEKEKKEIEDLAKSYEEAKESYELAKETGEGLGAAKKNLDNISKDLIDTLYEEGGALEKQIGDYKALDKEILKVIRDKAKLEADEAENYVEGAKGVIEKTGERVSNTSRVPNYIMPQEKQAGKNLISLSGYFNYEKEVYDVLKDIAQKDKYNNKFNLSSNTSFEATNTAIAYDSEDTLLLLELLEEAEEKLRKDKDFSEVDSGSYEMLVDIIADIKENLGDDISPEEIEKNRKIEIENRIQEALATEKINDNMPNTQQEYEKWQEDFIKKLTESNPDITEEAIKKALENNEYVGSFATYANAYQELLNETPKWLKEIEANGKTKIENLIDKYGFNAVGEVLAGTEDYYTEQKEGELISKIYRKQVQQNEQLIEDFSDNLRDAIKDGFDSESWVKFKQSYIDDEDKFKKYFLEDQGLLNKLGLTIENANKHTVVTALANLVSEGRFEDFLKLYNLESKKELQNRLNLLNSLYSSGTKPPEGLSDDYTTYSWDIIFQTLLRKLFEDAGLLPEEYESILEEFKKNNNLVLEGQRFKKSALDKLFEDITNLTGIDFNLDSLQSQIAIIDALSGNGKTLDPFEINSDPFYRVNKLIESSTEKMEKLSEVSENAYGDPGKLQAIQNEIDHLNNTHLPALQEKLRMIKNEEGTGLLDSTLVTLGDTDWGLIWDKDIGGFTNKTEVESKLAAYVNNAGSNEDERKKREDDVNHIKELIDNAETYYEEWKATKIAIDDTKLKVKELGDTYQQLSFDYKLEDIEKESAKLEHYLNLTNEDGLYDAAKRLNLITQQGAEAFEEYGLRLGALIKAQEDYKNNSSNAQIAENLKEATENFYAAAQAADQFKDSIVEALMSGLNLGAEKITTITDELESLNSILDSYNNIMGLQGKAISRGISKSVYGAQKNNYGDIFAAKANEADYWKKSIEETTKLLENASEEEKIRLETSLAEMNQSLRDAQQEALSALESSMEAVKKIAEIGLEEAKEIFDKNISGGLGLEFLAESVEEEAEIADQYLTDTNKMYEVNKLDREAQLEIDKTDNLLAKQRLKAYQEELKALERKTDVSEFELTLAKERFEVLKAQIALEEAQANKSQMRLVRNAAGGYSYVYTTDETNVAQAQQQFDDAQNKQYNTIRKQIQDSYSSYIDVMSQTSDELDELNKQRLNGEISEEDYQKQRAQIIKNAQERLWFYETQFQTAKEALVQEGYEIELDYLNESIIDTKKWSEELTKYNGSADAANKKYTESVENATTAIENANDALNSKNGLGLTLDNLKNAGDGAKKALTELYPVITNIAKELFATYNNSSVKNKEISSYDPNVDYSSRMLSSKSLDELNQNAIYRDEKISDIEGFDGVPTETLRKFMEIYLNKKEKDEQGYDKWKAANDLMWIINKHLKENPGAGLTEWQIGQMEKITAMATGGYTGSWGAGGRLAILHEKELVLNKQDTQNVLDAVQILRDMSSALGNEIRANALGLASTIGSRSFKVGFDGKETVVQQVVSIDATFPGVQSAVEIETALQSLVNDAAQQVSIRRD